MRDCQTRSSQPEFLQSGYCEYKDDEEERASREVLRNRKEELGDKLKPHFSHFVGKVYEQVRDIVGGFGQFSQDCLPEGHNYVQNSMIDPPFGEKQLGPYCGVDRVEEIDGALIKIGEGLLELEANNGKFLTNEKLLAARQAGGLERHAKVVAKNIGARGSPPGVGGWAAGCCVVQ